MVKDVRIRFTYTKFYKNTIKDNRRDYVYEKIWAFLRLMESKGYIRIDHITTY